jgi:Holliday junction DNA helicase RuvB
LDIVIGKGPSARTVRLDLPRFTLIGATTRFGLLTGPFRDRFGLVQRLEFYDTPGLQRILNNAAKKLKAKLPESAATAIARRSRGTPRIALKLFKRVREYAQVENGGKITSDTVDRALKMFAIDELGLDHNDRRFLIELINKHSGGPVGLSTIAATLHEDPGTIEEVIEPYLLQVGLLQRTTKGRVISKLAYEHLGLNFPEK